MNACSWEIAAKGRNKSHLKDRSLPIFLLVLTFQKAPEAKHHWYCRGGNVPYCLSVYHTCYHFHIRASVT